MKRYFHLITIVCVVFLLSGCQETLYTGLSEGEANQMLALLIFHHIDADKTMAKDDTVTVSVDKNDFVNAVELLRQNGLPTKKRITVDELFPSGQLVTSPAQEQEKITYLKEQDIERMLRAIDGVIDAEVTIAQGTGATFRAPPPPSVSVFIKYSPDYNVQSLQGDIRRLVSNSILNLPPQNISLMMQAAEYRFSSQNALGGNVPAATATQPAQYASAWWGKYRARIAFSLLGIALLLVVIASVFFFFGGLPAFAGKGWWDKKQEPQ